MRERLCAVIVETRQVNNLREVVENHLIYLPNNTGLVMHVGHGTNVSDVLNSHIVSTPARPISITRRGDINSVEDYNFLLTHYDFWNELSEHYDYALIFQTDSRLLKKGIEKYYSFDYVGSPWQFQKTGGNGGLSLRKIPAMKDICLKFTYDSTQGNEDVFFCNIMHNKNIHNLAPREVCEIFGCESIYAEGTFGYHAIEKYLTPEQCEKIKNQYK